MLTFRLPFPVAIHKTPSSLHGWITATGKQNTFNMHHKSLRNGIKIFHKEIND